MIPWRSWAETLRTTIGANGVALIARNDDMIQGNQQQRGENPVDTKRHWEGVPPLEPAIDLRCCFLSPRGTSGERIKERGIHVERASSPQPSPPSFVRRRGRRRGGQVQGFKAESSASGKSLPVNRPTPDPSQEGNCRCRASAVLFPSWEGLGVGLPRLFSGDSFWQPV